MSTPEPTPRHPSSDGAHGTTSRRRRRAGSLVAGVAAVGLVVGAAGAGLAAAAPAQASGFDRTGFSGPLRDDVEEMRTAEPSERPALARELLARGLDGDYGDAGQRAAERVQDRLDPLPDDLTDELFDLLALPRDERRAEIQRILDAARAGDYGDEVQSLVEGFDANGRGAFRAPVSSEA
jgi:hypothetical protein